MDELRPEDLEELVRELKQEYDTDESLPTGVGMKVRVCPKCGKHNSENAWHCLDCGTTLSVKTLVDVEDGQPSVVSIAGQLGLSRISPHFEQDVVELLDTVLQDDESVIWGGNITQIARTPPFRFGYLLVTSQRLIGVQFESKVTRDAEYTGPQLLLSPFTFLMKEALGQNVRPQRPWIGATVPAVSYPSYPLTPKELASRWVAVYDLENLVSANLESAWFGDMLFVSLTARFHQDKKATFTLYTPHEAQEVHKLLAAWLE